MEDLIIMLCMVIMVVGIITSVKYISNVYDNWINDNEKNAYKIVDNIYNDKKWEGKNMELIHSVHVLQKRNDYIGVKYYDQLCRSNKGNYILLKMMLNGRAKNIEIWGHKIMSEDEAKEWLEPYEEQYIETFGDIEKA